MSKHVLCHSPHQWPKATLTGDLYVTKQVISISISMSGCISIVTVGNNNISGFLCRWLFPLLTLEFAE